MKERKDLLVFFGDKGLTTTSANHIANLAKETYQEIEEKLSSITLYETYIKVLNNDNGQMPVLTKTSSNGNVLGEIEDDLIKIAKLKSLIAWLREAISAKKSLDNIIEHMHTDDIAQILGIETPKIASVEPMMTSQDYIGEHFDIKKRNRYFYLETVCATIGEAIHPKGSFSKARKDFIKIKNNPTSTVINPNDGNGLSYVYTYQPAFSAKDVESTYFKLQSTYREYQKELNSMKYEIETAVKEDEIRYTTEQKKAQTEYSEKIGVFLKTVSEWALQERNKISKYKIVIPNDLKDIYDYVTWQSKKE